MGGIGKLMEISLGKGGPVYRRWDGLGKGGRREDVNWWARWE